MSTHGSHPVDQNTQRDQNSQHEHHDSQLDGHLSTEKLLSSWENTHSHSWWSHTPHPHGWWVNLVKKHQENHDTQHEDQFSQKDHLWTEKLLSLWENTHFHSWWNLTPHQHGWWVNSENQKELQDEKCQSFHSTCPFLEPDDHEEQELLQRQQSETVSSTSLESQYDQEHPPTVPNDQNDSQKRNSDEENERECGGRNDSEKRTKFWMSDVIYDVTSRTWRQRQDRHMKDVHHIIS